MTLNELILSVALIFFSLWCLTDIIFKIERIIEMRRDRNSHY